MVLKSANYNAVAGDVVYCNTSAGGFTVTIPLSASSLDKTVTVKKVTRDGNTVTVANTSSDLTDLSTPWILAYFEDSMTIRADGTTNWYIE